METLSIINQLTSSSVKKLGENNTQLGLMLNKLPNSCSRMSPGNYMCARVSFTKLLTCKTNEHFYAILRCHVILFWGIPEEGATAICRVKLHTIVRLAILGIGKLEVWWLYGLMLIVMNSLSSCYEYTPKRLPSLPSFHSSVWLPRIRAVEHHNVLLLEQRMPSLTQRLNLLRVGHILSMPFTWGQWMIHSHD